MRGYATIAHVLDALPGALNAVTGEHTAQSDAVATSDEPSQGISDLVDRADDHAEQIIRHVDMDHANAHLLDTDISTAELEQEGGVSPPPQLEARCPTAPRLATEPPTPVRRSEVLVDGVFGCAALPCPVTILSARPRHHQFASRRSLLEKVYLWLARKPSIESPSVCRVVFAIALDGDRHGDARVGNADAVAALVGFVCSCKQPRVRIGAIKCLRGTRHTMPHPHALHPMRASERPRIRFVCTRAEIVTHNPTNIICLARADERHARPLLDLLAAALATCDEPVPHYSPPSLTPHADGGLWSELASLLLLLTFLLSNADDGQADYIPRRLLANAVLHESLPHALSHQPSTIGDEPTSLRWRELHALCELSTDLAARGRLKDQRWFRFGAQLTSACLGALTVAVPLLGGGSGGRHHAGAAQMCSWVLQAMGTLARASPSLIQHVDSSGGLRLLCDVAVASAAATPAPPAEQSAPEPWETALWLVGELTAIGTRSGRATSGVRELIALLRGCSAEALAALQPTAPRDVEAWAVYPPDALRRALLDIHANETPGGTISNTRVPPRACAAVLTTIGELLETSRTRARRGLSAIRKQLVDAGALPLVLLQVSDSSATPSSMMCTTPPFPCPSTELDWPSNVADLRWPPILPPASCCANHPTQRREVT